MKAAEISRGGLILGGGILTGIAACAFLTRVTLWGHFIPSANVATDYAFALLLSAMIWLSIWIWPINKEDRSVLLILWLLRTLVALGGMLLYENAYGLDAYTYYLEAKELTYDWKDVGFGNGTGNIGLMVWYINKFLPADNSYHSTKVIFSLIGMLSIFLFYRAMVSYTRREQPRLLLFLGAFPSLVFWSSILGKDPVVLLGISIYCVGTLRWLSSPRMHWVVVSLAGVALASAIRPWTALILAVPSVVLGLFYIRNRMLQVIYLGLFSSMLYFSTQVFVEHFSLVSVDELVRKTNIISKSWSIGGSRQEVPEFRSLQEMASFAPTGMFSALFRPLPFEVRNAFGLLAGLENAFLLFLVALAVKRFSLRRMGDPALVWSIALLVSWSLVYAFVSYQNLGSASRFRLQVLPVLLVTLMYLAYPQTEGDELEDTTGA